MAAAGGAVAALPPPDVTHAAMIAVRKITARLQVIVQAVFALTKSELSGNAVAQVKVEGLLQLGPEETKVQARQAGAALALYYGETDAVDTLCGGEGGIAVATADFANLLRLIRGLGVQLKRGATHEMLQQLRQQCQRRTEDVTDGLSKLLDAVQSVRLAATEARLNPTVAKLAPGNGLPCLTWQTVEDDVQAVIQKLAQCVELTALNQGQALPEGHAQSDSEEEEEERSTEQLMMSFAFSALTLEPWSMPASRPPSFSS